MNKAILVIDMPDSCSKCPLFGDHYADMCCRGLNNRGINYPYPKNFRQDWCPLKELPERMEGYDSIKWQWGEYEDGWNHCLDVILGDE